MQNIKKYESIENNASLEKKNENRSWQGSNWSPLRASLNSMRLYHYAMCASVFENGVSGIKTRVAFWLPRSRARLHLLPFEFWKLQRRFLLDATGPGKIKKQAHVI